MLHYGQRKKDAIIWSNGSSFPVSHLTTSLQQRYDALPQQLQAGDEPELRPNSASGSVFSSVESEDIVGSGPWQSW